MTSTYDTGDVYQTTLEDLQGSRERSRPGQDPSEKMYDRVPDPSGSGRMVSQKPANKPFLRSKARREAHRRAHAGKSSWSTFLLVLLFLPLLSQFTTNTYTFTLGDKYLPKIRKMVSTSQLNPFRAPLRTFSPEELGRFDGSDPWLPVYVGILGEVYDVTKNRRVYGKGGSYNMMAGRDASRSFVTGCFKTHLTHDLRGLTPDQLQAAESWRGFFQDHAEYKLVGHVLNHPIDPSSPIPADCHTQDAGNKAASNPQDVVKVHGPQPKHAQNPHAEL